MATPRPCDERPRFGGSRLTRTLNSNASPVRGSNRRSCHVLLLALVTAGFPVAVLADFRPENVTAGEMARLPDYCEDVQGFRYGDAYHNTSPRAPHWVAVMGQTFWALHHYCWALIYIHRNQQAHLNQQQRADLMRRAIADIRYVIGHAKPDFILLPELYLRIGECQVNLKDYSAAEAAFRESRQVKPDYWPPYVRWADVLVLLGKRQEARELLEQALRLMPAERALFAPYQKLGGKPGSFVASLPPPAQTVGAPASAASRP